MSFTLFFELELVGGEQPEELLENELVLLLDDLADGLGSELKFVLLDHADQALNLFLVLLPNLLIAFDLELQAFGLVDPVDPLAPGHSVSCLLEDLVELLLGRCYFLFLRVYNQIIIFRQNWDQGIFLLLDTPGQLLQKVKKFMLIDSVSLS
jgi:hypothetical protein